MKSIALTAFLVTAGAFLVLLVIGIIVAIILDIYRYQDLQERLKREQERKAVKQQLETVI